MGWSEGKIVRKKSDSPELLLLYSKSLGKGYILGVAGSMRPILRVGNIMLESLLGTFLIVFLFGGAVGYFLSKNAVNQFRLITITAKKIGQGSLGERIPVSQANDENDELKITLNQMFDRIERLMGNVKNVSTSIAHDLRTPLSRVRQKLEAISVASSNGQEVTPLVESSINDVDGILNTFSAILNIAEINAGYIRADFKSLDLSQIFEQVCDLYTPVFIEKGGQLDCKIESGVIFEGNKNLIQQLLSNLIENALTHSGDLNVIVELRSVNNIGIATIRDFGRGIPTEYLAKVFKPFFRGDEAREIRGSGLGLSLVAAISDLHNISITLENADPGLMITLEFPLQNKG